MCSILCTDADPFCLFVISTYCAVTSTIVAKRDADVRRLTDYAFGGLWVSRLMGGHYQLLFTAIAVR